MLGPQSGRRRGAGRRRRWARAPASRRAHRAARRVLADIAETRVWSARGVHRVLRIARTIADLGNASTVDPATIHAAAGLRDPQEQALAA
ncbi:MAG: hypothetical protein ACHQ02_00570 [Candidatus Limnocylindrales bacterium]